MVSRSRGSSGLTSGSGAAGLVALVAVALVATPGSPAAGAGKGQGAGSITGRVTLTDPPEPRMVAVTTDQAVCGTEVEDQAVVVDGSGGLANAVVLVAGVPWSERPSDAVINNAGCYFLPRVQVLPTRTVVTIKSEDDTLHSTHAYDDRQRTLFNIAIPFPGLEVQRPFRRPGPVRIECDSHGWMRGWVYVSDDLGTVTGSDGTFELTGIPPGTYQLTVWHERYEGAARQVTVTAGGTAEADFTLE
ncbi:MAG: carboxypeptidase regulatory-like domain-containing protein [Acidobacteria bacterium]|nr:carboxypeptidase regulatory-like domain-containing protein [Acidobacteriota bacterium]